MTSLSAIRDKVQAGQRLSFDDGLALEASNDLFTLGEFAQAVDGESFDWEEDDDEE